MAASWAPNYIKIHGKSVSRERFPGSSKILKKVQQSTTTMPPWLHHDHNARTCIFSYRLTIHGSGYWIQQRRTYASTAWLIFHKCTKNVCTVVGVSLAGTTLDAAFRETRPAEASGLRAHYFFITYLPSQDLLQSTIRELCASAWLAATWLKWRSMAADDALALFRQHYFLYLLPVEAHHMVTQHGLHAGWKYENKFWHH